jgi:hypothetical protein
MLSSSSTIRRRRRRRWREGYDDNGGGDGDDYTDVDSIRMVVALHEMLPSAQQQVAVVSIQTIIAGGEGRGRASRTRTSKGISISCPTVEWAEAMEEQQQRSLPEHDRSDDERWHDQQLVVVRRWLRASRWWNLNRSSSSQTENRSSADDQDGGDKDCSSASSIRDAAAWEIAGYRVARRALPSLVPRVLYSSADHHQHRPPPTQSAAAVRETNEDSDQGLRCPCAGPWAVLEYMPPRRGGSSSRSSSSQWVRGMVMVRHEYGFDEPHPRWGRVPADRSLEYALLVLNQVVIPLHRLRWCREMQQLDGYDGTNSNKRQNGYTFVYMVSVYEKAHASIATLAVRPDGDPGSSGCDGDTDHAAAKFSRAAQRLGEGVRSLRRLLAGPDDGAAAIPPLDPVLCHMDYQPQNLQFSEEDPRVVSGVLDWEEAAYGDPRFDLLLLGRKVCANEAQARAVWEEYNNHQAWEDPQPNDAADGRKKKVHTERPDRLGPLEPWLHLETVHSLASLLLQAAGEGGRSPWETQPDLWGKIERELVRLDRHEQRSVQAVGL